MAVIKAFKGMRFTEKAGDIAEVVCPPYDIIPEEQRLELIKRNEFNAIRLELPREGEDVYKKAGETLSVWIQKGILKKDETDCIYVYEIGFTHAGQSMAVRGIITAVELVEFEKGVVLPHEQTLSKAKEDRFNLMKATACNFSQVYSLYMDENGETESKIDTATKREPDISFVNSDGLTERLWIVEDKELCDSICADFKDKKLYIADGHHRYETGVRYRNYRRESEASGNFDNIMMMLVPMEQKGLVVLPTHRIVRDLEQFDEEKIIDSCKEYFDVEDFSDVSTIEEKLNEKYNEEKKAFAFYTKGDEYKILTLKDTAVMKELLPDLSEASQNLDVSVLHTLVLEKLFGIDKENMANQKNLTYTKQVEEAIEEVRAGKANCAFLLNPTRVSEIRDVALAGEKMPQKSTYFYPKLTTGLVMNAFDL